MEIESGVGRFMINLDRFRTALIDAPSGDIALGAADHVYNAMESGLVQPAMMAAMTIEARHFFAQAKELLPERSHEVTTRWARHEITTLHPEAALEMLDGELAHEHEGAGRQELVLLQEEAWFASFPS